MAGEAFRLRETRLKVIKENREYGIFLLDGGKLIFFPA
jgi:hypothetical protein